MHGLENVRRREGNVSEGGDGQGRNIRWVGWTLKDEEEISERRVGKGKNGGLFIAGGGKIVRRAMVHEWENVRRGTGKLVGSGGWARGKCKTGRVGEDKSVKRGRLARQKNCAHWIIFSTTVEKIDGAGEAICSTAVENIMLRGLFFPQAWKK